MDFSPYTLNNKSTHSLVNLAEKMFCELLLDGITAEVAYTSEVQESLAQSNYYCNPYFLKYYLETDFLPPLNFEVANTENIHDLSSLEKLVLIRAKEDTMVIPSNSEWFGFYAPNSFDQIIPYMESKVFEPLGLKTLGETKRLVFLSTPGDHIQIKTEFLKKIIKTYFYEYETRYNFRVVCHK